MAPIGAPESESCGFVFATTGEAYTILARRAARTLRQVMPDAQVDLFTDQLLDDPVFNQIHPLGDDFFRPKMEALRRARFVRTVYLDADVIVIADITDVFTLLGRCDIAGAHVQYRSRLIGGIDRSVPAAFPPINSGLLGRRASERTEAFMTDWERQVRDTKARYDQPLLRRLLYNSDLNLLVLPPEYNLLKLVLIEAWDESMGAPRMIHLGRLHKGPPGDPMQPFDLAVTLGTRRSSHLRRLIAADPSVGGNGQLRVPSPTKLFVRFMAPVYHFKRLLRRLLGRPA